jgi:hypothetical protein
MGHIPHHAPLGEGLFFFGLVILGFSWLVCQVWQRKKYRDSNRI